MPHFVVECSESILSMQKEEVICEQVHIAANSTALFGEKDIQVRVNSYKHYQLGNKKEDIVYVFARILEGRTKEQKANLSRTVVEKLAELFPQVEHIGIDIMDLEKGTGLYRSKL